MPYKRKYRKRRRGRRRSRKLTLTRTPMPKKFPCRLVYQDRIALTDIIGGVLKSHVFRMTSMYDPDLSGGGHQPRGFDQLMSMYDHYLVIGAKASITAVNKTTNITQVACTVKDDALVHSSINDYLEENKTATTILPSATSTNPIRHLTQRFSAKKFFSISKPLSDDVLKGTQSTTPAENAYLHIITNSLNASDTHTTEFNVKIEYLAILTEPNQPAQS